MICRQNVNEFVSFFREFRENPESDLQCGREYPPIPEAVLDGAEWERPQGPAKPESQCQSMTPVQDIEPKLTSDTLSLAKKSRGTPYPPREDMARGSDGPFD
jgi:hypothetical protein